MTGPGDIAAVIAVLGPDLTAAEWARTLGVSLLDVRGVADSQGVILAGDRIRSRALTVAQEEVVATAMGAGMSPPRVAEAFGVSVHTVYRLAKEAA